MTDASDTTHARNARSTPGGGTSTDIDLNCDLGEARPGTRRWLATSRDPADPANPADPADVALMDLVSSVNVACGGHAGTVHTMRSTVAAAVRRGVAVGAHPSYVDLAGFGRAGLGRAGSDVPPDVLHDQLLRQIVTLGEVARAAGVTLAHVKPHGALYNRIATDEAQAQAVVDAVRTAADRGLTRPKIFAPAESVVAALAARRGVGVVPEGFADRGYRADGTLQPRTEPDAVLVDADAVARRVLAFARRELITAVDGTTIRVDAVTVCVHGDTPGALELTRRIRAALDARGIAVRAPGAP